MYDIAIQINLATSGILLGIKTKQIPVIAIRIAPNNKYGRPFPRLVLVLSIIIPKKKLVIATIIAEKSGIKYATSTDTDIFLYDITTGKTTNICKPDDYVEPETDLTKSMKNQAVNSPENLKNNPGYDTNPQFSPDGKYIAWQSMARDGYESDRNRLCIYDINTGEKTYATETLDTNVDAFCWGANSDDLYFLAVWHGCENVYQTNLKGEVKQLTDGWNDYPGTNETGFNGYPTGYLYSSYSHMDGDTPVYNSGFAYVGDYAGWW